MSGGAFNYGHHKIERLQEEILDCLVEGERDLTETETIAVGSLLKTLAATAKQVKTVEWHFSYDTELKSCSLCPRPIEEEENYCEKCKEDFMELKAAGNSIVPLIAYEIFKAIEYAERTQNQTMGSCQSVSQKGI